ncbi:hypothetical protein [Zavarzinella formosa]|uniref:hypothetical protein n=1 Tax=Zavarzinella formosa TaxID=360055 RepID=UPI0002E82064|nr:hypothetical protein [Zavarzinella formosa]
MDIDPILKAAAAKAGGQLFHILAVPATDRTPSGGASSEDRKPPDPRDAFHGRDFACVSWFGRQYTFNATQRAVIAVLWGSWKDGTPWMSQDGIVDAADLPPGTRLKDVFANHVAWKSMIGRGAEHGEAVGTYGLVTPSKA